MKKYLLLLSITVYHFAFANKIETAYNQLASVNKQWLTQTNINPALKMDFAKPLNEIELIQFHLLQTEILLRSKNVSNLTEAQQKQRAINLDILHNYMLQGVFPINDNLKERTPFFIDKYNTYCAVGFLMKNTGGNEMAKEIHATQNNSYLLDIKHPSLAAWIKSSGISREELALIQPSYDIYKAAFLTEMHYNNAGADVNEYFEFMQSSGYAIPPGSNRIVKILFYNQNNFLYKTLLVSQMQSQTFPMIPIEPGFSYYTPQFYHYTFPANESFSDVGKIEFFGGVSPNYTTLYNVVTYNANQVVINDSWVVNSIGLINNVSKTFNSGENETTPVGFSLNLSGNYNPIEDPLDPGPNPQAPNYYLPNWNASLLPTTRGFLNVNSVLPITLSAFNHSIKNKTVNLNWTTENETNNNYFAIEKSTDGTNFEQIGSVNSQGNSSTAKQYNFIDYKPSAKNYYRIKQVDLSGRSSFSKIIVVKITDLNTITILGNPVKDELQIQLNIDNSKNNNVIIYDFLGRKIISQKGINGIQKIDISNLQAGKYIIQLINNDGSVENKSFLKTY